MDCGLSGSSVHVILQARILEWVAFPFSRGSSWPRGWTRFSCTAGRFFTIWATRECVPSLCHFLTWEHSKFLVKSKRDFLGNGRSCFCQRRTLWSSLRVWEFGILSAGPSSRMRNSLYSWLWREKDVCSAYLQTNKLKKPCYNLRFWKIKYSSLALSFIGSLKALSTFLALPLNLFTDIFLNKSLAHLISSWCLLCRVCKTIIGHSLIIFHETLSHHPGFSSQNHFY